MTTNDLGSGAEKRSAIITGGAGALGSAVARRLAKSGWGVALVDAPGAATRARALASELGRAIAIEADVTDVAAWAGVLARTRAELGPIEGAALIAGAWKGGKPLHEETDDSTWGAMLRANLETAHASLRALLPAMVERSRGSIVVVGSRAVERPWTSTAASAYAATKSAVVALAQTAAAEVLPHSVRVNAILPSTLDTPANRAAMPSADPTTWVALDSCAGLIAFLLSEDGRDVSGAAIPIYGRA